MAGGKGLHVRGRPDDQRQRRDSELLVQTAYFAPKGPPGLLCWYSLYPVRGAVFSGMIAALAAEASRSGPCQGGRHTLQSVTGRHPAEALRATSATCA